MYNLLIADDEAIIRRGLKRIIDWEKYNINIIGEAEDGKIALEIMGKFPIDIILLDICMPFINGLELLKELRKINTKCIIIIITGNTEFEYAKEAINLKVNNFLLKPLKKKEFEKTIEDAIIQIKEIKDKEAKNISKLIIKEKEDISPIVLSAIEYIEKNYFREDIGLELLADELEINSSYISKLMKKNLGLSFVEYLSEKRINTAIELMQNPTIKMYEVAQLVGYKDQYYFSRAFKKAKGSSPKEYLNRIINI